MINCLIVEDEPHAAKHLEYQLSQVDTSLHVVGKTNSVIKTVEWLKQNPVDLIFLDVQLRNDLCFEIFDHVQVRTPVIFTTSYNQYAVESFRVNSLSYLLKPIGKDELKSVINKYRFLYDYDSNNNNVPSISNEMVASLNPQYQKRFMVRLGNSIKSIPVEDVAYITIDKKYVLLVLKDGKTYLQESSLDTLEHRLNPERFFRINRQFIICIDAIKDMHIYTKGRLKIEVIPECKDEMIVGVEKAPEFKSWLSI